MDQTTAEAVELANRSPPLSSSSPLSSSTLSSSSPEDDDLEAGLQKALKSRSPGRYAAIQAAFIRFATRGCSRFPRSRSSCGGSASGDDSAGQRVDGRAQVAAVVSGTCSAGDGPGILAARPAAVTVDMARCPRALSSPVIKTTPVLPTQPDCASPPTGVAAAARPHPCRAVFKTEHVAARPDDVKAEQQHAEAERRGNEVVAGTPLLPALPMALPPMTTLPASLKRPTTDALTPAAPVRPDKRQRELPELTVEISAAAAVAIGRIRLRII